jgi:hypothetical protein
MTSTEKKYRKMVGQVVYLLDLKVNIVDEPFFRRELVLLENLRKIGSYNEYYITASMLNIGCERTYQASRIRFCEATTNEELLNEVKQYQWSIRRIMTLDTFKRMSPDVVWHEGGFIY